MDTLIKADIFFFITALAVGVLSIGFIIIMIYVIRILNDVKKISRTVRRETERIREDIEQLRSEVKESGFGLVPFVNFFHDIYRRYKKGRREQTGKTRKNGKKER